MNVGIDFGTTKSALAYSQGGKPVVIEDGHGHRSIPSLVMVVPDERLYIGWEALNHRARYDQATEHFTISSIKRLIGTSHKTSIGNFATTPQEVAALILGALQIHAEHRLRTKVTNAVIAVPAHFDINQRWATLQAAELAGIKVDRLLNEASAAILGCNRSHNKRDGLAIVFDFGGGTLDVSAVAFGGDVYQVLATAGDERLGGDDYDQLIVDWVVNEMSRRHGLDCQLNPIQQLVLREAATRAKIDLSTTTSTRIYIPGFIRVNGQYMNVDLVLSRNTFETLGHPLLKRAKTVLRKAIRAAGEKQNHFTDIIITGGTSRMPCVREMVREVVGNAPCTGVDPEVGVAEGASAMAALLAGSMKDLCLIDVTHATYSIELIDGKVKKLIAANTTVPTAAREVFTIGGTGNELSMRIYQGEGNKANENTLIGHVDFNGLPLKSQLEVTFQVDPNNTLSMSAKHLKSGQAVAAEMKAPHRLTPEGMRSVKPWVEQGLCSYRERYANT